MFSQVSIESVKAIVDRSEQCTQLVKYDCRDAKLFNAPGGDPASRWLSANGYLQYYWGGAKRDSYKCACAYTVKGCQGGGFCHCDSKFAETRAASDEGLLNVTRDLPVREVQFGGLSKTSQATYTIKRIDCYGVGKFRTIDCMYYCSLHSCPNGLGFISLFPHVSCTIGLIKYNPN